MFDKVSITGTKNNLHEYNAIKQLWNILETDNNQHQQATDKLTLNPKNRIIAPNYFYDVYWFNKLAIKNKFPQINISWIPKYNH